MNAKSKINQKNQPFAPTAGAAHWCQLQHVETFIGLTRRRFSRDEVLMLIDSRQIQWAWDIARKGAGRPEVRIWRESILAYLAREGGGPAPLAGDLSLPQVIEAVLPKVAAISLRATTVRGSELQRRFLCCPTHLSGLIADGELCRVGPSRPGATPVILYQSAFEFLKRRTLSI
jgi:hypothetical protein